jgi:hypothetical protein
VTLTTHFRLMLSSRMRGLRLFSVIRLYDMMVVHEDSFIFTCFTQKFIGGSFNDSGLNVIVVFSVTALSDAVSVIPTKRSMFSEYSIACIRLFFFRKGIVNEVG